MGWRRNLALETGMGAAENLRRMENDRLSLQSKQEKSQQAAEAARLEAQHVASQLESTRAEVHKMLEKVTTEMQEVERQKRNLMDELELVKMERGELREVLQKSKSDTGGPQAAECDMLRSELLALQEAKERREAELLAGMAVTRRRAPSNPASATNSPWSPRR